MRRELNLLPPSRRSLLTTQSMVDGITRVVKNLCWGLGVVTVGALLIILGLQTMAYMSARSGSSTLESDVAAYQKLREDISGQNKLYQLLAQIDSERMIWADKVRDLFGVLPPGLTVTKVSGGIATEATISFSGQAVNRNTLIVLEDRLRQLVWANKVDAPHANLIDRLSPTYTFTITVSPPKKGS